MSYWATFGDAVEEMIASMGEEFTVGGTTVRGVVGPLEVDPVDSPGGVREIVDGEILVTAATAAAIAEGGEVAVRGINGRVDKKRDTGAGVQLVLGGRNRWEG